MSNFPKPFGSKYIILPEEVKPETGGIIMPDELKEQPKRGTVIAKGRGYQAPENGVWILLEAEVGDKVSFGRFAGSPLVFENVSYMVMKEEDLLVIF